MKKINPQFWVGRKVNLYFYIFEGILAIFMGLIFDRFHLWTVIAIAALLIVSVILMHIYAKSPKLNPTQYGIIQNVMFVAMNILISFSFDSAQVFIYAMCFETILNFVFIDKKLSRFQFVQSLIIVIIAAAFVSTYTGSRHTMLVFTFGSVMLVVTNWVVMSMTIYINFQYQKNVEQEHSLDDMLRVVEAKCDDAQQATRSKTQFLANMSHEIRTPINAIMGMNEVILRESREPEIRNYASETMIAADSLLGIINDILDITKIEAGKLTLNPVKYNFLNFINDIYNLIRFRAESKELKLNFIIDENIPSAFTGDDIRLKQVLVNLLSNAVKYTHIGSVTLEAKYEGKGRIRFLVSDTGIGIKQEDIERLFDAFERFEQNKNRGIEGTGLGLNITASLLKMFGSELEVESKYGEGSVFSFVVFQEVVDPAPIGGVKLKVREHQNKSRNLCFKAPGAKILIVDDNAMNRKVFINLLKSTKISIDEADSGRECLSMVEKTAYDIIFMDHMMPEMDGIQTLEEMKKSDKNLCMETPVFMLTANAVVGAKEFYISKGFDGFLSKPIEPDKLEKIVFSTLGSKVTESDYSDSEAELSVPNEKTEEELPIISGVDWNYAMTHFKDRELLLNGIEMFYKSIKHDAEELSLYFDGINNDEGLSSYRIKVHSMKSSAALIGIFHLSGLALELETAAKSGNRDIIRLVHPVFIERWLGFRELLSVLVEKKTAKKRAADFKDEILEIFEGIRNGVEEMDVDILDAMSSKLDEYSFDDENEAKIEEIKAHIFNFELEELVNCRYE